MVDGDCWVPSYYIGAYVAPGTSGVPWLSRTRSRRIQSLSCSSGAGGLKAQSTSGGLALMTSSFAPQLGHMILSPTCVCSAMGMMAPHSGHGVDNMSFCPVCSSLYTARSGLMSFAPQRVWPWRRACVPFTSRTHYNSSVFKWCTRSVSVVCAGAFGRYNISTRAVHASGFWSLYPMPGTVRM